MASDNTIKTFTATDIEKYHAGQLTAREMHAMEKAALDDPFLADALEGYAVPGVDAAADIAELKKRLEQRSSRNKVIPIASVQKSSFPWFRAAAMIILVAGAGFLIYLIGFTDNKKESIANAPVPEVRKAEDKAVNSIKTIGTDTTDTALSQQSSTYTMPGQELQVSTDTTTRTSVTLNLKDFESSNLSQEFIAVKPDSTNLSGTLHFNTITPSANSNQANQSSAPKLNVDLLAKQKNEGESLNTERAKALAKNNARRQYEGYYKSPNVKADTTAFGKTYGDTDGDGIMDRYDDKKLLTTTTPKKQSALPTIAEKKEQAVAPRYNVFRGRVTDANNNALPFANITNTADNVGTYSDAKGNFTLISPDSVLNVQIRSVGFENGARQLQSSLRDNQVIMQEDNRSLSEVVINNNSRVNNSNRSRNNTIVHEEPEPVDGWSNYDIYVANNLKMPDTLTRMPSRRGEVELSFDVSQNGEPVNITVDKSLCESCDKEAIRLLKEGPKWKHKSNKRKRTSVTISF